MKLLQNPTRTLVSLAVSALCSANIYAGSFSLYTEASPIALGNYAAGAAAEAADASIGWYNPAGLVLIHDQQLSVGGIGVFPTSRITGSSTFATEGLEDYTQSFYNLNGAENAVIPVVHYALPLGQNATAGLSIVTPFGLSTEWSPAGPVRYAATHSELITTTVSPELGGKITDHFSIGGGLDLQYARVKFNTIIGAPAYLQELASVGFPVEPSNLDSYSYNKGDSFQVGFHAGLLWMFNENHTRLGLNYQSHMKHQFRGYSRLRGPLAEADINIFNPASIIAANPDAVFETNNLLSNDVEFPDILTLSAYHDLNEQLSLLASVVYTGWSSFKNIELDNVAAFSPLVGQVSINTVSEEIYKDVWRFALGANYKVNDHWLVRFGGGYDQTPTTDRSRDIRIADTNRWALSIGTHYQARPNIGVDIGYTHLFCAGEEPVNRTDFAGEGSTYNINAQANGSADIIGAQVVWLMDGVEKAASK